MAQDAANQPAPLKDVILFVDSINNFIGDGVTKFLEQNGSNLLSTAEREAALAKFFDEQFANYTLKANEFAEKAASTGNTAAARSWNTIADHFDRIAGERQSLGLEKWTKSLLSDLTGTIAKYAGPAGDAIDLVQMGGAVFSGDFDRLGEVATGVFLSALAVQAALPVVGAIAAGGRPLIAAVALGLVAWGAAELGEHLWKKMGIDNLRLANLPPQIATLVLLAKLFTPRRDPLILDLDGDGISTVGLASVRPIFFDHDGDGIRTATGWISPNDGFLVLDRNANGLVDDGTELFSDATWVNDVNGGSRRAVDGFDALRPQDTNQDGSVNADDTGFSNLRIWRDLNVDGISQADELSSLSAAGISSINLVKTANRVQLPDGNLIGDIGTFTRSDGTAGNLGDVSLREDTFRSRFVESIPILPEAALLPTLAGSGKVRNLREAASLSPNVLTRLSQYSGVGNRNEQLMLLDDLIKAWSETSTMPTTATGAYSNHQLTITFQGVQNGSAQYNQWIEKLSVLERFDGQTFRVPPEVSQTVNFVFTPGHMNLLERAYQTLRQTVYLSLYLQTRGNVYMNTLGLLADPDGRLYVDFTGFELLLDERITADMEAGLLDLADLIHANGTELLDSGWNGVEYLANVLENNDLTPELLGKLRAEGIAVLDVAQTNYSGSEEVVDLIIGNSASNYLIGRGGDDQIVGGLGSDAIEGGEGDDFLDGGAGNDRLSGFTGSDTYYFSLGSGQDTVLEVGANIGDFDSVVLDNLLSTDVRLRWIGPNLSIESTSTGDVLTILDYFRPDNTGSMIERIVFSNGEQWSIDNIRQHVLTGSDLNDIITGTNDNDALSGYGGRDLIIGLGGNDEINGGAGDDFLSSANLPLDYRFVSGSEGIYSLYFTIFPQIPDSPNGNDTYQFGRGYGQDTIVDRDSSLLNTDIIRFDDDVTPSDVTLLRNGDDLQLKIVDTGDSLTVKRWFYQNESPDWRVEEIRFADGTIWNVYDIQRVALLLASTPSNDEISGFSTDDTIRPLGGNDTVRGRLGDDYLDGGEGDDRLYGDGGDDTLTGGAGYDALFGGAGNDTYLFNRGDGADYIDDFDGTAGNHDVIVLGSDISPDQVTVSRFGHDLWFSIDGASDSLQVWFWFYNDRPDGQIEEVRFADGTVWDVATLKTLVLGGTPADDYIVGYQTDDVIQGRDGNDLLFGLSGNDSIYGDNGSDQLYGEEGNDQLFGGDGSDLLAGGKGDDILDGGSGNDRLYGGNFWRSSIYDHTSNGNDTYIFGRGQGTDTIVDIDGVAGNHDVISFSGDTLPEDVIVRRTGSDLHLRIAGTDDNLYVSNFFSGAEHRVEEVRFADGTVWDVLALYARGLIPTPSDDAITGYDTNDTLTGLEGADVLRGLEGDDQLDGGLGDDDLDGGAGSDVYVYSAGVGNDVIRDSGTSTGGTDTVLLNGLTPDDVTLSLAGPDLIVQINATGENLTLMGWQSGTNGIEQLVFGDGTVWDEATIRSFPFAGTGSDDYLEGTGAADVLDGGAGDDVIDGRGGNDHLYGSVGNDRLYASGHTYFDGGAGNDQIYAGQGNDTYLVSNDGFDVISDGGGANTMVFAPGITLADLSIQAYRAIESGDGDFEVIQIAVGTGDGTGAYYSSEVYVYSDEAGGYLYGGVPASLQFVFADGTTLTQAEIFARADGGLIGFHRGTADNDVMIGSIIDDQLEADDGNDVINGRGGDDSLTGWGGNDLIGGGTGNDTISGDWGDDILAGGKGDDSLSGGTENNAYLYNRGDGHDYISSWNWESLTDMDTFSFGLGIQPGDVFGHVDPYGALVLTFGGDDSITIPWFSIYNGNVSIPEAAIERVQFVSPNGTRVFDFAGLVESLSVDLLAADAANPVTLFTPATAGFELTGTVAPVSEEHVIAYGLTGDLFAVAAQQIGGAGTDDILRGTAGDDTVTDLGGNNTILAGDGNNVVTTGTGNDAITTGSGNDVIVSGDGVDRIDAGAGNDAITGGLSNDTLIGGAGNDTYYFNLGDGVDQIDDLAGGGEGNRVVFGPGIAPDDLKLSYDGSMLVMDVGTGGDGLRLSNFDPANPLGAHAIDTFEFADGSVLSYAELIGRGLGLTGSDTDDLLVGTGVADRIVAQGGNDVIVGGAGNDLLDGGSGNDLYVFNLGDGVDTLVDRASPGVGNAVVFGPGITSADLSLRLDTAGTSPALVIQVGTGGDAIRLDGFNPDDASGSRAVETFRFADGVSLSYDQLLSLGIAVDGTSAAETLTGTNVRDRLHGAGGNDLLAGGEGDDTYFFNANDGTVTINDVASPIDPNTLVFGSGISPADLQLGLDAEVGELVIRVGQNGDAVRLSGFNPDDPYGDHAVEFYRFADGSVLTYAQLIDRGFDVLGTSGNDDLLGTATVDRITGSAGHDLIRGGAGGDVAAGGAGDDTYVYRIGDGILTIDDLATIGEGNTLEFGEGIALADMRNRLSYLPPASGQTTGAFIIRIGEGTGDEVHLMNFDRDDAEVGARAVELFRFADGTTVNYRQLVQNTFIVQGDTGDDALRGTNLTDRLYGYEGSDTLRGNLGNDTLTGGTGNDELHGEDGDDTYVFNLGDGIDTIHEIATPAAPNRIVFGVGVALTDLRFEQVGNLLTIHYGSQGDAIQLPDFNFSNVGGTVVVSTLEFSDGGTADLATLMNQSPVLDAPLADVAVRVEDVLSYAVPVGIFSDPDVGDTLTYSASLADGSVLPSWLQFDASSGSFTGTPALGDLGALDVRVTATDALGLSANDSFTLFVVPRNRAPEVAQPLADQAVDEDAAVNLAIPADAFTDPDAGDTLAYSATLADGSVLPAWLAFDPDTRTFSGTPTNNDVGVLEIQVTATDGQGASVSDVFTLTVNNVNDAPVLASAIADQSTTEGQAFNFTLNPATFSDDDAIHGDTLSFSATLAVGAALPGWLTFDSSTQAFSGTAPDDSTVTGTDGDDVMVSNDADVVHTIRVTATDTGGLSVSDDFALTAHDASPDDVYDGQGGNDRLDTGLGHDTLTGGTGDDVLLGGAGNDIYVYNVGDGLDTLTDTDGVDTLRFGNDITAEQVVMRISAADGLARLRFLDADGCETTDQGIDITLNADGSLPIESIVLADGSSLSPQELVIQSLTWYGTNQADVFTTGRHDDTIYGGNGKDVLTSGSGNDTLYGDNGDDRLYGQGGHDTLTGGRGDDLLDGGCGDDTLVADQGEDTLVGGQGSDTILLGQGEHTILFGVGDGQDVIKTLPSDDEEHDTEAEVVFGPGIDPNKLWFARNGDDLTVQLLGTQDRMTLEDWYTTSHKPIEEFQTVDGSELEARQVELLVQAMAQFAPGLSADGSLPADQQQELNAVIAAAWESGH